MRMLDAALAAQDLVVVGKAYDWLRARGMLQHFGSYKPSDSADSRLVTPAILKATAGIEASRLSPKKWGAGGGLAPVALFAGVSALINNGADVRPLLIGALALAAADALLLGGTGLGQLLSLLWPPYRKRVLVHEAGHVVAAYLLGCPVRGVILDAMEAVRNGIRGQAGTQFWDAALESELREGRLMSATLDRYCIVLFAGIAAEALVYGEAQGGESDENLYKAVVSQLQPPWSPPQMSNHARWAVLQAFTLLRERRAVHAAVVRALERGATMAELAEEIEASMPAAVSTA